MIGWESVVDGRGSCVAVSVCPYCRDVVCGAHGVGSCDRPNVTDCGVPGTNDDADRCHCDCEIDVLHADCTANDDDHGSAHISLQHYFRLAGAKKAGTHIIYMDRETGQYWNQLTSITLVKGSHVHSTVQHEHHSLERKRLTVLIHA